MKQKSFLVSTFVAALSFIAFAQSGPAGKWTGTMSQGAQPAGEITEAKIVDADTISFKRSVQGRGGNIEIEYTGKIKGNEMTLTPTVAGGRGGGRGPTEITLKRAS